ncbi:hypothetical protein AJ79_06652 [Helicocarpus griseus UAMH5409]|uniref:N-acetylgalactosaminide beta-1,3-galactosyltransferase n=1 Tax=Helicocarpus griseus UAMH5409 TaxID=1447875 RepID=A0A2B7XB07_9EURO|nr:hypothetical protein AJ79_06652 [Helicocarpus griseus UAMH5409]
MPFLLHSGNTPSLRWVYFLSPFFLFLVGSYLFWPTTTLSSPVHDTAKPNYSQPSNNNSQPSSSPEVEIKKPPLQGVIPPSSGEILPTPPEEIRCPWIPGIEDIHVVVKTGASEALEKLHIHANTTLHCVPHYTIFSDYEEDVSGFHVYDVLKGVADEVKNSHPDFQIYNRLRESGRVALAEYDINDDPSTPSGKPQNPGWVLDKWKFLPMMHETLTMRPNAKWYVFMEVDTYFMWPNLLSWLEQFNYRKSYYLGNQMKIGDTVFGHGGSGVILSQAALQRVVAFHSTRVKEWDDFTARHWAGDCVLGKALQDAGVGLTWSWPMLHGFTPNTFDHLSPAYAGKLPWCYPPVAYHHMTPEDIRRTWDFEQYWAKDRADLLILHSDVFRELVQRRLSKAERDWDNQSGDLIEGVASVSDCATLCARNAECRQYSFETGNHCRTSNVVRRGESRSGIVSGWMSERINQTVTELGLCEEYTWIRP